MMLVPSTFPDKNVRGDFHLTVPADMEHKMKSCIEDEFHSGRSVQTWQCLPSEGSLSSIESFPGAIEASSTSMFQKSLLLSDDDSGTDAGQDGSPLRGAFDHSADEGHANRRSEETPSRVKLMCSFGGKILPRPSDGKLRYVGGETRIVSVNRDVTYSELMSKMKEQYGQDLSLKYQLPNEDLDALISVSTDEDLQNMMEEYDRLEGGDGLQRLRVFLFSTSDVDVIIDPLGDPKKSEQWYVEAVNGILETSSKKSESGISVGGISARPSADNLVALDTMDPHSISHIEEQAALLLSKKMQDMHGAFAGNSASSSPSLLPQQPHSRHLGKMNDHPYAMFSSEGQQHFALFNPDLGHSDVDHYYANPRTEMLPSTHDHDRKVRGYNTEAMLPRVGSHGKLSRLQEQHDDPPHGHSDLDHYYTNPRTEMLPATHEHDRKVRGYNTEAILPRVGSHGKLSRLQEQHDDPPHGQQDLLSQDLLMEPRPRFIVQQPQPHILHIRQHPLEPNQDYRRPEYSLSDNGYPHLLQQHQPPTQPLHYHKDTIYRADQYQQHHRHQLPEEPYPAHELIPQQHHIQHQEEYFPGHMYHRTSSHIDGSGSGISTHSTAYQIGSSPSSPRLPFRDGRQSGLHQQLPVHRAYGLDHPYGRRSHVHEEAARAYRLSSSPPRYRDHHIDDQRPLLQQHHAINQDRFPQDQISVMFDQKQPPEVLPRAALPLFGPGFQEGPVYYQENSHRGGEARRHVQTSPHITSRADYQEQLMQMEQLSLHNQSQRYHDHPDKAIDWQERNLETEEPRVNQVRMERQHELPEGNHNAEYESPVTMNGVYLDNQATTPFVVHGSGLGHAAHLVHASQRFTDSRVVQPSLHDGSRIVPDEGVYSSRVKSSMSRPSSSSNVAGLVNDKPTIPTQEGPMATASFHSISLPVFDRSGVFEVPSDAISQWSANVDGATNGQSEVFPTIKSGVVEVASREPRATKDEGFPAYASYNQAARNTIAAQLSETGHLAEDMASSVLRSSLLEQGEQGVELAPQLTFTVQAWDNVREDMTCNDTETLCKEENLENLDQSTEVFDKVLDNTPEDPPTNIALTAEREAISRGLQTIRNSDLEEIRELGSGTYGTVYHGKWRGTDVAIKRIKASCFAGKPLERERLVADFWREACTLSQLHHPNCVAFYGVVPDGPGGTLATVTEYMVNGSLKQVLQKKDRTIDRRKRLLIGTDAAFGMEYLHGKNIVHFDLKCENLLVNMRDPHRPICKVGDLGLSKVKRQTMVSGGVRGTLPWMAPELLSASSGMVTERVDVFSFGIVMWELLTGEEPYANMHYGAIIGGIVNNTLRPPIPNWCDPAWRSLMERCWAADPSARPSFSEIASELRAMAASLQSKN